MISFTHLMSCSAWLLMERPVVSNDTLTPAFFKISHKPKKFGFSSASPPDITTCLVPSSFKEASKPLMSCSVSCLRFLLPFQISHITQRQLHALCGISITMGNADMRCVFKVRYLW